jgi:hypothetical protein
MINKKEMKKNKKLLKLKINNKKRNRSEYVDFYLKKTNILNINKQKLINNQNELTKIINKIIPINISYDYKMKNIRILLKDNNNEYEYQIQKNKLYFQKKLIINYINLLENKFWEGGVIPSDYKNYSILLEKDIKYNDEISTSIKKFIIDNEKLVNDISSPINNLILIKGDFIKSDDFFDIDFNNEEIDEIIFLKSTNEKYIFKCISKNELISKKRILKENFYKIFITK